MSSYLLPRPFPYDTKRFRGNLRIYGIAVIALAAAGLLMKWMAAGNITVVYILMIAALFLLIWMIAVPFPLLSTTHVVTGEAVVLRQGLGFNLSIPFDNIAGIKAKELSSKPGLRVDRAEGTLYVIAAGGGNVRIMLRDPQTVKHGAFDCVVLDVKEPREFVSCVKERRKGEALMRSLEEEPLRKASDAAPGEEPMAVDVVAEQPAEKPAPRRRPAPPSREDEHPMAREPGRGARIVRVAKK